MVATNRRCRCSVPVPGATESGKPKPKTYEELLEEAKKKQELAMKKLVVKTPSPNRRRSVSPSLSPNSSSSSTTQTAVESIASPASEPSSAGKREDASSLAHVANSRSVQEATAAPQSNSPTATKDTASLARPIQHRPGCPEYRPEPTSARAAAKNAALQARLERLAGSQKRSRRLVFLLPALEYRLDPPADLQRTAIKQIVRSSTLAGPRRKR